MRRVEVTPAVALRCLIDSMVFDAIADDAEVRAEVARLTDLRAVELLAALDTMRELDATPDGARRRALQRVRVLVVPSPQGSDPAMGRLLASPGVSDEDARIAVTAAAHGVPLVTEDRELRDAVAAHLPATPLWTVRDELLPRVAALTRAHPPRTPRRRR